MKSCSFHLVTERLQVRIVDSQMNLEDSISYCEKFGEILAPINNAIKLEDTLNHLQNCYSDQIRATSFRASSFYRIGLFFNNSVGMWSNGQVYSADKDSKIFIYSAPVNLDFDEKADHI